MGRRWKALVAVSCVVALAAGGLLVARLSVRAGDPVRDLEERFGIHVLVHISTVDALLPASLDDANWGLKQTAVLESGYDLRPYAATTVTLSKYVIRERYEGNLLYLWLVLSDGQVVGAYATVTEVSDLVPGVFSVREVARQR